MEETYRILAREHESDLEREANRRIRIGSLERAGGVTRAAAHTHDPPLASKRWGVRTALRRLAAAAGV